jgi:hypothetical protein
MRELHLTAYSSVPPWLPATQIARIRPKCVYWVGSVGSSGDESLEFMAACERGDLLRLT